MSNDATKEKGIWAYVSESVQQPTLIFPKDAIAALQKYSHSKGVDASLVDRFTSILESYTLAELRDLFLVFLRSGDGLLTISVILTPNPSSFRNRIAGEMQCEVDAEGIIQRLYTGSDGVVGGLRREGMLVRPVAPYGQAVYALLYPEIIQQLHDDDIFRGMLVETASDGSFNEHKVVLALGKRGEEETMIGQSAEQVFIVEYLKDKERAFTVGYQSQATGVEQIELHSYKKDQVTEAKDDILLFLVQGEFPPKRESRCVV